MTFTVTTGRAGPLGIHELLQRHANDIWLSAYLTDDQATAFVPDHFRRLIESELAMVTIKRNCSAA